MNTRKKQKLKIHTGSVSKMALFMVNFQDKIRGRQRISTKKGREQIIKLKGIVSHNEGELIANYPKMLQFTHKFREKIANNLSPFTHKFGKRSPSICRDLRISLGKRSPSICKMCTPAIFNASQNSEFLRVWFFSLAYNDQNVL